MKKNILRELLNAGKPTLSTRMVTTSPQIVEMIDGGLHGGSMRRNTGYGLETASAEWAQAMREVVVDVMIEESRTEQQR